MDVTSPTTIILTNLFCAAASELKSSVLVKIIMGRVHTLWIENHEILSTASNEYWKVFILPEKYVCMAID